MHFQTTDHMSARQPPQFPLFRNRILAALPPEELAIVQPHLSRVSLVASQILLESDVVPDAVYFIEQGLVALLADIGGGEAMQIAMVGAESVRGAGVMVLPAAVVLYPNRVEVAGTAYRMRTAEFRLAIAQAPVLRELCLSHINTVVHQIAQTSACNGRHDLQKRLCRLLLMAHDRSEDDDILLTQGQIAGMIGVRRAGVSTVMAALHDGGYLRQSRGRVTLLDRQGIVAMACECHARMTP